MCDRPGIVAKSPAQQAALSPPESRTSTSFNRPYGESVVRYEIRQSARPVTFRLRRLAHLGNERPYALLRSGAGAALRSSRMRVCTSVSFLATGDVIAKG